jgi:hypothetical protein
LAAAHAVLLHVALGTHHGGIPAALAALAALAEGVLPVHHPKDSSLRGGPRVTSFFPFLSKIIISDAS